MVGVIHYIDTEGNTRACYFTGLKYGETPEEYLTRKGIKFTKVTEWYDEG